MGIFPIKVPATQIFPNIPETFNEFVTITDFSEGFGRSFIEQKEEERKIFFFLNPQMEVLRKTSFSHAEPFKKGFAKIKIYQDNGYININGAISIRRKKCA